MSNVDALLSLRDGFERFASKTDEIGHVLEIELRHLLEEWDERVQKARYQERERQNDLSDALRDLHWCESRDTYGNPPNCSYEQGRVEKAKRDLAKAEAYLQLVGRCLREVHRTCEAFQKHGLALRRVATQTAPNAASYMNLLLRDVENYSFVTSAHSANVAHASIGSASAGGPPVDKTIEEPTKAVPPIRLSPSIRGLALLLQGQLASPSPPDATQIEFAAKNLCSLTELAPEVWSGLTEHQRIEVLGVVECLMAKLQGRSPVPVTIGSEGINIYGGYDAQKGSIALNEDFIRGASPREIIETIVHTGRHAYQAYAMRNPAFHPNPDEVGRWRINNLYYLHADVWGDEAYRNQPVEKDAFAYTEAVMRRLHEYEEEALND
ncbi:hypothetical protein EON83_14355 [bacterium]|nr:MAG: hypothetical protein EON83_14355 [bacterium]